MESVMSEINKALSQLAAKRGASLEQIEAARVAPVKTRPGWVWALGGCALSLALGGWAVSWQAPHSLPADEGQGEPVLLAAQQTELAPTASPTRNTSPTAIEVYRPSRTVSDAPREKMSLKPRPDLSHSLYPSRHRDRRRRSNLLRRSQIVNRLPIHRHRAWKAITVTRT
ncbi:hypothetical protein KNV97_17000 [Vibrio ostreae]|uniref:Uncharacterized protein n=1 Tax=Vibrio ostreae TaxID=2841925 RepID=A0A975YN42_9VIBR|nr:hypothetical protein [Vibrio ostreae]QXO17115.1 hypothetical protein KNV97_17000 [Vibrio ostreae]